MNIFRSIGHMVLNLREEIPLEIELIIPTSVCLDLCTNCS